MTIIIRMKDVTKRVGLSRSTIYQKIKNGEFPPSVLYRRCGCTFSRVAGHHHRCMGYRTVEPRRLTVMAHTNIPEWIAPLHGGPQAGARPCPTLGFTQHLG
ncbi:helix-turn-helix transcriptional regulator [Cupriavidus basilensis]